MKPTNQYYENYAKQRITEALLSLMENENFNQITITKITEKANIARRTFYLYYNSKLEILNGYFDVLCREYDSSITKDTLKDLYSQALYFFSFWNKYKSYLEVLYHQHMLYILMSRFHSYLHDSVTAVSTREQLVYVHAFYAGGLWAILYQWTENNFHETPEELAEDVTEILLQKQKAR